MRASASAMSWLQPLLLAMLARATTAHGHTRRLIGPAPATATTALPAAAGCGDSLSAEVGAGGALSAVFAVPATGVAAVTFSTCGTVLDAVLAFDDVDGQGDDAGGGDACSKCGGSKNKPSGRVLVQVAARRPGATIPVRVRFRNARDTGTLRLDVKCHGTSRVMVARRARGALALALRGSPMPPAITCGGSVSLKVAAGGELRRSFAATPATDVATLSASGAGDDATVLVVDGQEVDSAHFKLTTASAQQRPPGSHTTVIAVRFFNANTAGALRLTVACRTASSTAAPAPSMPTQSGMAVAQSTTPPPWCGIHPLFMSCVQGAYISNCCTGSCGATRVSCFNCDDPTDGGPQCFSAPAVRSCADQHHCKASVSLMMPMPMPPTARAPTGAPTTATLTLLGAAHAATMAPTDGLPSNCGYAQQNCAGHAKCWSCQSSGLRMIPGGSLAFADDTKDIDLSWNLLTMIELTTFANLTALTHLFLNSNRLTMIELTTFANLTALTRLDLTSNLLTGLQSTVFSTLTALTVLIVNSNQLTVIAPTCFSTLTGLTELNLSSNNLTRIEPETFTNITALITLDLGCNQLTGLGALTLSGLTALRELFLGSNRLTWLESTTFWTLVSLDGLFLFENLLTGIEPETFTNFTALITLDLRSNQLTVIPPSAFSRLTALAMLNLADNQLTVVASTTSLKGLTTLKLYSNNLTRIEPATFGTLSRLTTLHLYSNQLAWLEPATFTHLTALHTLTLHSNQLTVVAAATFMNLTALTVLYLFRNQLTWLEPTTFARLSALTKLDLNLNQLTRLGPTTFCSLTALTRLNLDYNQLAWLEPKTLLKLTALTQLFLNFNLLTGLAPSTFSTLAALMELALSANQLTGLQKGTFAALSSLGRLNLAGNLIQAVENGVFEFAAMHAGLKGTFSTQVPRFLYNPNPLQCGTSNSNSSAGSAVWDGTGSLRCTLCTQGYVETNASAAPPQVHRRHVACVNPHFRLDNGPDAQRTLDALRHGLNGSDAYIGEELDVYQHAAAGDRVFTPKRDKFRGYAPENRSFAAIRFEVKVGEVDIGCGAVVVGSLHGPGSEASRITQTYQQPQLSNNIAYSPISLCKGRQRLLRFEVLANGHFDFASCGSRFPASLGVYNASCNGTDGWLADCLVAPYTEAQDPQYNQASPYVSEAPLLHLPGRYSCPVGPSANLSNVYLPKGTYLLGVQPLPIDPAPASPDDMFEVDMHCRDGDATAAPLDPTDGGVVVNPVTGQLTVAPGRTATPGNYSLILAAIDSAGSIAPLLNETLQIRRRPMLTLTTTTTTTCGRDVNRTSAVNIRDKNLENGPSRRHDLGSVVVFPAFLNGTDSDDDCSAANTFANFRSDANGAPLIRYDVFIATSDGNTTDLGQDTFVNGRTGKLSFTLDPHLGAGKYSVSLRASTGDAGSPLTLQSWEMDVRPKDTATATNGPNGRGCGDHGTPKDDRPQDDAYTCRCDPEFPEFEGENCETPIAAIIGGTVLGSVLVVAVVAKLASWFWRQRARAIGKRRLARMSLSIDVAAPADALFAALALDCDHLIGDLLKHGADAAERHSETHKLAHTVVLARPTPDPTLLTMLFRAHCDIDAQIGLLLRQPGKLAVLEQALLELARERWRSPGGSTLLHVVVDSCRLQSLHESGALQLATSLLAEDPQLLTATDGRSRTVATLAAECDDAPDLERLLTMVVFDRYQLLRAERPLHRSSTSMVTACRDLDWVGGHNSAAGPLVLKMMQDEGSWARELQSRGALKGAVNVESTTVPVRSAAVISTVPVGVLGQVIGGVTIHHCPETALRNARHGLASDLMTKYPFAICMPLAERNLLEIIQSERASGQPIGVLAYTARKIAVTIKALHDSGVVHADLKPRNIVRTEGHAYRLIDFDMAFSFHEIGGGSGGGGGPAEALPADHASASKIDASNAYAAPELVRWSVAAAGRGNTAAAGRAAIQSLGTPARVDILSFGMTLYELITGVPLHEHAYDQLTARALQMVLTGWPGLDENAAEQLKALHPGQDLTPTIDLLRWMLDADPMNRPDSMGQVLAHTFFDPQGGTMREHFLVEQIRAKLEDMDSVRDCPKIMISYCWDDSNFVLGKLGIALAGRVRGLWLDRLGGDQGMGAWARASMDRGVAGADVVIAVLSRKYTQSENCGFEMELADLHHKEVIPIVLGLPFDDWKALKKIGKTELKTQFHDAATGDGKLFVDFTKPELFETKLHQELLPRLTAKHQQLQRARMGMFAQRWQRQAMPSSPGRNMSVGLPPPRSQTGTTAWSPEAMVLPTGRARSRSLTSASTGPAFASTTFGNHANPVFDWQSISAGASLVPRPMSAGANPP